MSAILGGYFTSLHSADYFGQKQQRVIVKISSKDCMDVEHGLIVCKLRAAPKLKDVSLESSKARELYLQCIQMVRKMYHDCHLIHADFSEFNLL